MVEDNAHFRLAISAVLEGVVDITTMASTLAQAMEALSSCQSFDGVISDLNLTSGGKEGLKVLERANRLNIRCLILYTQDPRMVPAAWRRAYPHIKIVEKGSVHELLRGVA